ncbi:hypothetical protein [Undibacterium sp.]|uniref:hypothetical protein n=1 Tax=Undibacterium sp. TaxID=1914977 RepID=UPI002B9758FE|nr:hypothetical protein [Undibacterium sp.]HTD04186.1 hypothetical protein [Undibacterium sp.]
MQFNQESAAKTAHPAVALSAMDMVKLLDVKDREIVHLRRQVAWFQRQVLGQKNERRLREPEGVQGTLGMWKQMFAANPLRCDLHELVGRRTYAGA